MKRKLNTRPMHGPNRVLFVDHTAQLGGGEIALRNLIRHFDRSRIEPVVLVFSDGPLVDQLKDLCEVILFPISAKIGDARKDGIQWSSLSKIADAFGAISFAWKLSRKIKDLDVQLVHTNSLKSHVLGGIAAKMAGCTVVWHLRDRIAPDYLPSAAISLMRVLSRIVPHCVIANSRATLRTIEEVSDNLPETDASRRGWRVVHDGCEVKLPHAAIRAGGMPHVGLIGRISPWKGQHIFLKAAALVHRQYPSARYRIIGSALFNETEYESQLKALCHDLGLDDVVEFTGFVHDVQQVMAGLAIVVHASTSGEPFGQVVIEAMAAEKPVIATNGGGIPEIVQDSVTGILIPMNDERALAHAMLKLLNDPSRAQVMGKRGRERVIDHFTLPRSARAVEKTYADLLGAPSRHLHAGDVAQTSEDVRIAS